MPGRTPGINNNVDVRYVLRGMIIDWQKCERGERYILGGENRSYGDFMQLVARVAGTKAPRWNVPRAAATVFGWVGDLRESLGGEPLINSISVRYAYSPRFMFTSAKAEAALGYTRGPLEDAVRDGVAWFRAHGMLP
jgi:dihydroflavonol-4-reductase